MEETTDKTVIAKQNYENFHRKMASLLKEEPKQRISVYVFHNDGTSTEDFYWSDHELTPTGFYKWIKTYNKPNTFRTKHIHEVHIPDFLYKRLITMIEQPTENINIDGVVVINKSLIKSKDF